MNEELTAAVEHVYAVFGEAPLSQGLEVCTCPVCMSEDTLARIAGELPRNLSPDLIQEYSNSAHGVPGNLDDLKLLFPRYLDLLARGEPVDDLSIGTELARFGAALRAYPDFYTEGEERARLAWMRAYIAAGAPGLGLSGALETLVCGGFKVAALGAALIDVFDGRHGDRHLAEFARDVTGPETLRWNARGGVTLDYFGIGYADPSEREALANWLNCGALAERLLRASDAPLPADDASAIDRLLGLTGQISATALPNHPA